MVERRRFMRYPVYYPVQYKCDDDNPRDSSITLNVSEAGALLSIRKILENKSGLIVRVVLKNKEYFLRAKVIHTQNTNETGLYSVGVEFMERPVEFVGRFYEDLETIMLYQKHYKEETGRRYIAFRSVDEVELQHSRMEINR